jgi:hypothetical protein
MPMPGAGVIFLFLASVCQSAYAWPSINWGEERIIIGRVEKIELEDLDMKLKARIDTGAGVSSVHADILEIKKPKQVGDPERSVFRITDDKGNSRTLERNIVE